MKHRLLNLVTALSLLLCAAMVVLWVRSYVVADVILWRSGGPAAARGMYDATSARGVFRLQCQWSAFEGPEPPAGVRVALEVAWPEGHRREDPAAVAGLRGGSWWNRIGFAFERERRQWPAPYGLTSVQRRLFVSVPYWFMTLLSAAPTLWLVRAVRGRRRQPGHDRRCRSCGYDLRATPDRCPECGMIGPSLPAV
jgi:hypothetical protein